MDVIVGERSYKLTRTGLAWYGTPLDKDELGGDAVTTRKGPIVQSLLYTFYHYALRHPVSRLSKYQNGLLSITLFIDTDPENSLRMQWQCTH